MDSNGEEFHIDITIGMLTGLVEVVTLFKGRVDLHILLRELGMELGMLLRTIDVAEKLGLVKVENGDVVTTPKGVLFSRKTSSGKLKMLRETVAEVEPFKSIIKTLEESKQGMSAEEINARLNLCKDEERMEQFNSFLMDWLVTTGWLSYDGEARTFSIASRRYVRNKATGHGSKNYL